MDSNHRSIRSTLPFRKGGITTPTREAVWKKSSNYVFMKYNISPTFTGSCFAKRSPQRNNTCLAIQLARIWRVGIYYRHHQRVVAKPHILTSNDLQITDDDEHSLYTAKYLLPHLCYDILCNFYFVCPYKAYELHLEDFTIYQRTNQSYPRQESNLRPNQLSSYKAVALPLSYERLFSLIQLIFQFIEVGY